MSRPLFGFLCCIVFEGQTFCCYILICVIRINDVLLPLFCPQKGQKSTAGTKHCKMEEHRRASRALAKPSCQRLTNVGFGRGINVMNYVTCVQCILIYLLLCLVHFDLCLTSLLLCLVHFDFCLTNLLLCLLNLNLC